VDSSRLVGDWLSRLYGVRGQNAVRPRFLLVLPTAVAVTKRFVQSEAADGAPSPWGEGWGEGKGRVQLHHFGLD